MDTFSGSMQEATFYLHSLSLQVDLGYVICTGNCAVGTLTSCVLLATCEAVHQIVNPRALGGNSTRCIRLLFNDAAKVHI